MAGDEGQEAERDSPQASDFVTKQQFDDFTKVILETLQAGLALRASECATPAVLMLAQPTLGEVASGRRAGEAIERCQGRELFPDSPAVSPLGEQDRRVVTIPQRGSGSPLCDLILSAPVPEGFRDPVMTFYTGKEDPVQHVQWFEDQVSIRQMTDPFKCKLFSVTFKDKARDWFHQLPSSTIYSFEDLRRGFLLRFSTSKKRKKGAEAIFLIKQKPEETLADYTDRFQEEVLLIQETPGHTLQLAFTLGLRQGMFRMELTRDPPRSFEELIDRATREIECEATNPDFVSGLARIRGGSSGAPGGQR